MPTELEIPRTLDLRALLARKSHFLLGPRQTGKTFLIRTTLGDVRAYDLLNSATFLALSRNPGLIADEIGDEKLVVVDEIQRLPELLNEIHRLIESRRVRFLLTGSSARRLRSGGVNLLGGRARVKHLHPLTSAELGKRYDLRRAVSRGLLPSIYFSDDPRADLAAYTGTYLQQEVLAEGLTRNAPAFSRFLQVAALCNATMVNFTAVSNDAQVPRTTVYEYFRILEDTLLLHELPAWRESKTRRPILSSKYYFFDVGVVSSLQGRDPQPGTPEFGAAVETLVMHELRSYADYRTGEPVRYWRSASGYEVDFLLGDHTAIEVKAKSTIASQDLRSLRALAEEKSFKRLVCVGLHARPRRVDNIEVIPFMHFLEALWAGEYR